MSHPPYRKCMLKVLKPMGRGCQGVRFISGAYIRRLCSPVDARKSIAARAAIAGCCIPFGNGPNCAGVEEQSHPLQIIIRKSTLLTDPEYKKQQRRRT